MPVSGYLSLDYLLAELDGGDVMASGPKSHRPPTPLRHEFESGTTAPTQVDRIFAKRDSVLAGQTNTYDLAGSLTDRFGQTITFAKICVILLVNRSIVATDILRIGGHSSNPFATPWNGTNPLNNCQPGANAAYPGIVYLVNPHGWTVTAGTGDVLRVVETGGANNVSYDLLLVGRSA